MPRNGLITLLFTLLPLSVNASNLIKLAHKAGFDRCDTAISTEFKDLAEKGNGVASTGYFNNRSFNIMATWGSEKDSVWKKHHVYKVWPELPCLQCDRNGIQCHLPSL